MALISVIVPVYNGADTIERCLDSILAQSHKDIEVIVIDDGSLDNTADIVRNTDDDRISVFRCENSGQGFARNMGLDRARGEYIAFVDADDTIEEQMLEKMYRAAEKSGADVAQCNILDIFPDGSKKIQLDTADETVAISDRGGYTDKYFTPCRHSYEVCNKLIKSEVIDGLRFGDTKKYFSEDLLFNLGLIERMNKITFISEPLYNYYQSDTSHMHSGAEKRLAALLMLFGDYIGGADGEMKEAAKYTAAMVLSYSSGECSGSGTARGMYKSSEFKGYIKAALKRKCRKSHKLFLSAMRLAPARLRAGLCKMYGRRFLR